MASRVKVDERGRIQIPREERELASIPANSEVMVVPRSPGHLELILVGQPRLELFQKKIRGRLKNWKEDEHRADALLQALTGRKRTDRVDPEDPIFRSVRRASKPGRRIRTDL